MKMFFLLALLVSGTVSAYAPENFSLCHKETKVCDDFQMLMDITVLTTTDTHYKVSDSAGVFIYDRRDYELVDRDIKLMKKVYPQLPKKKKLKDGRGRFSFLDAMSQFGQAGISTANDVLGKSGIVEAWGGFKTESGTNVEARFNFKSDTWVINVSGSGYSCECSSNP
jgi:hypothetical protein